jgi:hypothetical protein
MAEIIGSRFTGDKIIYSIAVDEEENLALQGRIKNINIFALDLCDTDSKIMARGKHGTTKYFLIPTKYRSRSRKKLNVKSPQAIETDTKAVYIYVCEKADSKNPLSMG